MTRARATDAPRIARPFTLTPWQGKRHLWQAKRTSFHLRHDDRVKKGVPHYLNLYPFPFPLSLLPQGPDKGIFRKGSFSAKETGSEPPTDQGFEGCALRGSATAPEHWAPSPLLIRGSKVAPCGVRQPPQSTRAPSPLLIRGSKAGPSEGFDSRPRACRVKDDPGYVRYMAEARATLPRYPRTFPRPAGTICNGIPPEGGIEPSDPIKWVRVQQITRGYFWSTPPGH
jgi:hypothetical protein